MNHLLDVLRQAVENEKKLVNEVALPGVKFEIKEVRIFPIFAHFAC